MTMTVLAIAIATAEGMRGAAIIDEKGQIGSDQLRLLGVWKKCGGGGGVRGGAVVRNGAALTKTGEPLKMIAFALWSFPVRVCMDSRLWTHSGPLSVCDFRAPNECPLIIFHIDVGSFDGCLL